MSGELTNRREFIGRAAAGAVAACWTRPRAAEAAAAKDMLHIACNQYPWGTFYGREGRAFGADLQASLREVADSGMQGYEPLLESPSAVEQLAPVLQANTLEMRSLYVNSTLHEADGDIDYRKLARRLLDLGVKPHLVLEQAVEQGSPQTLSAVEAHRRSRQYAAEVFAGFAE